jgi:hypothetical protein
MSAMARIMICTVLAAFALALTASRSHAAPAPKTKKSEYKFKYLQRVPVKPVKKTKKATAPAKAMSREIVFDGSNVNGRYHSAGEAVARVESEKELNNLIGVRKDFKDRLAMERARLKAPSSGQ